MAWCGEENTSVIIVDSIRDDQWRVKITNVIVAASAAAAFVLFDDVIHRSDECRLLLSDTR